MIKAEFLSYGKDLVGFSVSGHAGAGRYGQDIVCAAVSSAVMLTANTITEFLFTKADVKVLDNKVLLVIRDPDSASSIAGKQVIASFKKHLELISEDEKGKIINTIQSKDTIETMLERYPNLTKEQKEKIQGELEELGIHPNIGTSLKHQKSAKNKEKFEKALTELRTKLEQEGIEITEDEFYDDAQDYFLNVPEETAMQIENNLLQCRGMRG